MLLSTEDPSLDVLQPLVEGVSFAITGQPGQGKTTALAYMAGLIARRETSSQALNDSIPILIHINDLLPTIQSNPDPARRHYRTGCETLTGYDHAPSSGIITEFIE